jgi:hypothetical protein
MFRVREASGAPRDLPDDILQRRAVIYAVRRHGSAPCSASRRRAWRATAVNGITCSSCVGSCVRVSSIWFDVQAKGSSLEHPAPADFANLR